MAGTTRRRTQGARPKSEGRSRVKGAKARSTAQRPSETKATARQASAQAAAEETKRPQSSTSILDQARPEGAPIRARTLRAGPKSEGRSRVKGAKARSTAQRLSETRGTERQAAAEETKRPQSSASILGEARPEEAPLRGRTLLELCMSNPSFRAKVISRLIRELG